MSREQRLAAAFVRLADTLTEDFDVLDLLHTLAEQAVQLLDVAAAAVLLADPRGRPDVVASTARGARDLEVLALAIDEGPCVEVFETGSAIINVPLAEAARRWQRFTDAAAAQGYRAVHAVPMRLREDVVGALGLFSATTDPLTDDDVAIAEALAVVATIGLLQERSPHQQEVLAAQLQSALSQRIGVEQATGVVAEHTGATTGDAFEAMKSFGRSHGRSISAVAEAVLAGDPSIAELVRPRP